MTMYHDTIMDHYRNPRHYGCERCKTSAISTMRNPACGDRMKVGIRTHEGIITSLCFDAEGCALSIASASLLLEHAYGKTLNEVRSFTTDTIRLLLNIDITPARLGCATIGLKSLQEAIALDQH